MEFQPKWTRHVGKVAATARFFCVETTAEQITEALGLEPTDAQTAQERPEGVKGVRNFTMWSYDSSSKITSSDLNDHVKHLLDVFLPLRSRIEELRPLPHITVCTYWESTVAGIAGPQLDAKCISGIAALGANLEIKVAKIEEVKDA
jgi:hypothetical protein